MAKASAKSRNAPLKRQVAAKSVTAKPARKAPQKAANRRAAKTPTGRARVRALEARIDRVLRRLMREASASRCTLRFDDDARGWSVSIPCGEARRAGIATLKLDGSINQRGAATAQWIDRHRRNLVQPDVTRATDPAPPPALIKVYGVQAQMLSPIFRQDGWLQGWISVHYLGAPYPIGQEEITALDRANAEIRALIGA